MSQFNDTFIKACRRENTSHTPVWFMRQAGRYQEPYRNLRKKYGFLDMCRIPEVCAEVTLLPIKQMDADAAILFSDIAIPFAPMGIPFDIKENYGPHIEKPVRTPADVDALRDFDPAQELDYIGKSIELLVAELNVPLIGFCGAPFTLASYMIEGGSTKSFSLSKGFMYSEPKAWENLMQKLVNMLVKYLEYQVNSGCKALQVFDSWVGNLSRDDYQQYVMPHMKQLFTELKKRVDVPVIHFGVTTSHMIDMIQDSGGDVIGLDWRTEIPGALETLGENVAIQGNLDPVALLAPWDVLEKKAAKILDEAPSNRHVFNLGHGILPPTNPDTLVRLVDFIHNYSKK